MGTTYNLTTWLKLIILFFEVCKQLLICLLLQGEEIPRIGEDFIEVRSFPVFGIKEVDLRYLARPVLIVGKVCHRIITHQDEHPRKLQTEQTHHSVMVDEVFAEPPRVASLDCFFPYVHCSMILTS